LLDTHVQYKYPGKYRAKMPGYEETLNFVTVNTNMTKKILQVRSKNDGLTPLQVESGVRSIISRGKSTPVNPKIVMSFKEQRDSIKRLGNPGIAVEY
jgi:hypothetical protein